MEIRVGVLLHFLCVVLFCSVADPGLLGGYFSRLLNEKRDVEDYCEEVSKLLTPYTTQTPSDLQNTSHMHALTL